MQTQRKCPDQIKGTEIEDLYLQSELEDARLEGTKIGLEEGRANGFVGGRAEGRAEGPAEGGKGSRSDRCRS